MTELLRVAKDKMPVSKQTAYNWNHKKIYPRLLYKVSGILFFDMGEWETMASKAKIVSEAEANK